MVMGAPGLVPVPTDAEQATEPVASKSPLANNLKQSKRICVVAKWWQNLAPMSERLKGNPSPGMAR